MAYRVITPAKENNENKRILLVKGACIIHTGYHYDFNGILYAKLQLLNPFD